MHLHPVMADSSALGLRDQPHTDLRAEERGYTVENMNDLQRTTSDTGPLGDATLNGTSEIACGLRRSALIARTACQGRQRRVKSFGEIMLSAKPDSADHENAGGSGGEP
jgi:hypothetical protein